MAKRHEGRLFLTIGGIVAGAMIFLNLFESILVVENTKAKVRQLNVDRYVDVANGYSTIVKNTLESYFAHMDYYVNADVVQTRDTAQIVEWLRNHESQRANEFDYVAWVDEKGDFYSDIGTQTTVTDRDYFQGIMQHGRETFIDNPVSSKTSGKTIVHICRACKINGKTIGFFCAVVNLNHLSALLDDINIGSSGLAILFSGNNQMITQTGDQTILNGDLKSLESAFAETDLDTNNGVFWSESETTGKVLNIYRSIEYTQWGMLIIIKRSVITGIATSIATFMTIFSILLSVCVILIVVVTIWRSLMPLKYVEATIHDISTGNADLSYRINIDSKNEIGRVVLSFNQFNEKLQEIMTSIKGTKDFLINTGMDLNQCTADTAAAITQIIANIESMGASINVQSFSVSETSGAVNEIAANIESLNKMIENQASSIEQASASIEQMIGNINSVNSSVEKMADDFEELRRNAVIGLQKQDDAYSKIELIESDSEALQEANTVISAIAEQTNLLAMNAAIEAAHAGDAGKGFSVVADEIRKLSETSSSQSETIGNQLSSILVNINSMVEASQEAQKAFSVVSAGIEKTNEVVQVISGSMEEQREGSRQISQALNAMNQSTSEVKSSSYEMAEGNKSILVEIKKLQDSTDNMKYGMEEMSAGADQINKTGTMLSDIAGQMREAIRKIGQQVDQFKV